MIFIKNINPGKVNNIKFFLFFFLFLIISNKSFSLESLEGNYTGLKVLDKTIKMIKKITIMEGYKK